MKRIYADLHLCPDMKHFNDVTQVITGAARLGYRFIGISFSPKVTATEIQQVRALCEEAGLDLVPRLDLHPPTPRRLLAALRKFRRRFEIIAVFCVSKPVARQAAKDRRVDLLNFPSLHFRKRFFDKEEAELASNALASLEIDMKPLLIFDGVTRIRLLSMLRKEVAVACKFHVPIIISSGVPVGHLMRKPRAFAALASLFDLDRPTRIAAVSTSPLQIVERNREKLSKDFVAPGIRIIRRGNNC